MRSLFLTLSLALSSLPLCASAGPAKNVIFFLGDGMGPTTVTAARIMRYGEDGLLHFERIERTARIKTYAYDAQTTDSSPSMSSYMTGEKMKNEVMSMDWEANAVLPAKDAHGNPTVNRCPPGVGKAVPTLLELAKARGLAVGSVTTTELTHATPGATYAHVCHRQAQYEIARQAVPGGEGYNAALGDGVDVLMGGGRHHFTPWAEKTNPKGRDDGRDLLAEFRARGYTVATTKDEMAAAQRGRKFVGIYNSSSHLEYEIERQAVPPKGEAATQPTLAAMALKAIDLLSDRPQGFFLMVEGGRIDHGLHSTNAKRALTETVAFDDAFQAVLERMQQLDPGLKETLIVLTADHDHTASFQGWGKRGNPVLDIVRSYRDGEPARDADGKTYTAIVFGNGPNRPPVRAELDSATVMANDYKQETGVRLAGETHGGGDVKLYAVGAGSAAFKGTMENTRVFTLIRAAWGW